MEKKELFKKGLIMRRGELDNHTDCENDIVIIHIPSKTGKRFHGSFWITEFREDLEKYCQGFEDTTAFTKDELFHWMTVDLHGFDFMTQPDKWNEG